MRGSEFCFRAGWKSPLAVSGSWPRSPRPAPCARLTPWNSGTNGYSPDGRGSIRRRPQKSQSGERTSLC